MRSSRKEERSVIGGERGLMSLIFLPGLRSVPRMARHRRSLHEWEDMYDGPVVVGGMPNVFVYLYIYIARSKTKSEYREKPG